MLREDEILFLEGLKKDEHIQKIDKCFNDGELYIPAPTAYYRKYVHIRAKLLGLYSCRLSTDNTWCLEHNVKGTWEFGSCCEDEPKCPINQYCLRKGRNGPGVTRTTIYGVKISKTPITLSKSNMRRRRRIAEELKKKK